MAWDPKAVGSTSQADNQYAPPGDNGLAFANTFAEARLGDPAAGSTTAQTINQNTFQQITLPTKITDSGNNFNPTTGLYTVPSTGIYLVLLKIRPVDNVVVGSNFGIGVHTSLADNPSFQWQSTLVQPTTGGVRRYVVDWQRMSMFNAGDQLRAVAYADGFNLPLAVASFTVKRMS